MAAQIFAREISPGMWQWASCDDQGQWSQEQYRTGDSEALRAEYDSTVPVNMAMRGQQVVSTRLQLEQKQKKHAAQLIPFELEDELSSNVDGLHFSFSHSDKETSVLYASEEHCAKAIQDLNKQGCDVRTTLPEYLLLQRASGQITLLYEAGVVSARLSEHWGFSVEQELIQMILDRLAKQSALADSPPESIKLIANSEEELSKLKSWLPKSWEEIETTTSLNGFWGSVDTSLSAASLNLRRGRFSRQLPFARWWLSWKLPCVFFAIAFFVAIGVHLTAYFSAKSEEKRLREQINAVYLDAVPNGRLGDVEGILESKLKSVNKASDDPTNFTYLLSKVVAVAANNEALTISSFSYSGDQRALQLTLEFASLDELSKVREQLQAEGIESDSPRTTSLGDGYQARIKLRETK